MVLMYNIMDYIMSYISTHLFHINMQCMFLAKNPEKSFFFFFFPQKSKIHKRSMLDFTGLFLFSLVSKVVLFLFTSPATQ